MLVSPCFSVFDYSTQVERYELFPKLSLNPLHLHLGVLSKCKVSID